MGLLSCQELFNRCVDILDSYHNFDLSGENCNSIEEILTYLNSLERTDQIFITEIFLGCSEFSRLLNMPVNDFYEHESTALLSDRTLLKITTYLVTFRINDFKVEGMSEFILQMNQAESILQFLRFYLNQEYLTSKLSLKWCEVCDDDFIEDAIEKFVRSLDILNDMCHYVERTLISSKKKKRSPRKDLRKFGDDVLSLKPLLISRDDLWKMFLGSCRPDKKEILRMNDWKKTFNHFVEGFNLPCNSLEEDSITNATNNNNDNLNTNNNQSSCDVKSKNKAKVIRMNTAAILREGILYRKKDEELMKKIDQWESGGGDPAGYKGWQKRVKEEEEQRKYEEQALMRLMGKLTKEQSILARQKNFEEKRRAAEVMRAQAGKLMQEFLMLKLDEEEKMRQKRQKVSSMKKESKEARRKMSELKARAVQCMQEEFREMMRIALEEAEQEMRQRLEVIRKIRDLETNRTVRSKVVDLNETSGCGLHSEMSLLKLKERLKEMQEEEGKRIEAKKSEILQNKQVKEQMIQDTLSNIARHRDEIARVACARHEEKKRSSSSSSSSAMRHKTQAILELETRYEDLRMRRMFAKQHGNELATSQRKLICMQPNNASSAPIACTDVTYGELTRASQPMADERSRLELLAV